MIKTFHIRFKVTSYDYNKLCNDLTHLVIDFLVANDIIPFSDLSHCAVQVEEAGIEKQ